MNIDGQARLFLLTVLMGAGIGLFYDVFRIFRRTAPFAKNRLAVQLEDLFFWIIVTGAMFYFMLEQSFGEIRLFSLLGAFLGIIFYFATLSRFVIKIFVAIIEYLKKVVITALRIILTPIRFAIKFITPHLQKVRSGLYRLLRYVKIRIRKTARNLFILRKKV